MVAGFWFRWLSVSDLLRAIGSGGVSILLLLPGFIALVPMTVAIALAVLAFAHGLTLTKTIAPAFGIVFVFQITRDILTHSNVGAAAGCDLLIVIPLHFKHHFILGRGQVAELALGAQAQPEVA
jgi:hypothetical protein